MNDLEELAKWHEAEAEQHEAMDARSGIPADINCWWRTVAKRHRASAAACRELATKREDDCKACLHGLMHGRCPLCPDPVAEAEAATDAALKEIE